MFVNRTWPATAVLLLISVLQAHAQDRIISRRGADERITTGEIIGTTPDGSPRIRLADGSTTVVQISEVLSIDKAESPQIQQARKAFANRDFEAAIAAAQPITEQFPGLPLSWVVEAFGIVADSHLALNQLDQAAEWYDKISKAYSATQFALKADIGRAKIAKLSGDINQATQAVSPIIERAKQTLRPNPVESQVFADAFFLQGELLMLQEQYNEALASFLRIPALYPENPTLSAQALRRAEELTQKHKAIVN